VAAVPAAVYVAVSVPESGRVKHLARGDLIIGPPSERTKHLADLFGRAGIPCRVSDNIEGELWLKLPAQLRTERDLRVGTCPLRTNRAKLTMQKS